MYLVLMLLLTAGAMAQQTDMDKVVKMQNQQKNELLARQTQESADLTTQINKMKEEDKQAYDKKLNGLDKNSPTYNQDRAKIIGEQAVISGRTDQLAKTSLARLKNEHEGQQVSMLKQHVANTNAIKNNMNDPKYQIQQKANNKLGILANQRNNVINNAEARKQGAQDFAQNKLKSLKSDLYALMVLLALELLRLSKVSFSKSLMFIDISDLSLGLICNIEYGFFNDIFYYYY